MSTCAYTDSQKENAETKDSTLNQEYFLST